MAKVIFDGTKEAERMASFLEENERVLGRSLMILQCDGMTSESTYVRLKREMGERLGAVVTVQFAVDKEELKELLAESNRDETVDGILIQLPILGADRDEAEQVLSSINPKKDIDGLNPKSSFIPAVVRAVERTLDIFKISEDDRVAVVGAKGTIGSRLVSHLRVLNIPAEELDKGDDLGRLRDFDVIITATGVEGLIEGDMVSEGFTGIDLGFPKAEFTREAIEKASLITPVPGGIGPMTVVALFENLADADLI